MPDFRERSHQPEWMDDPDISRASFEACLRSLERVNIATFAYRPTFHWLTHLPKSTSWNLLDVGCGGGDMLRRIWRWGRRHGLELNLTGVDLNPWSKSLADALIPAGAAIQHETKDIFTFPENRKADLIISSLFTHHLDDGQLTRFLRWMEAHAEVGWFINDLHRHPLPYHFIRLATRLCRANPIVQHDAPVSVARSFTRKEWTRLLEQAGIPLHEVQIRWFFPFRYGIGRVKR